jgi:sugar/nucleoside kinase (ribokinase family)
VRIPFRVPARQEKPFDVVGFGLNSIDLLAVVAEHPVKNTKQRLHRFARLPGGQMATASAVCARLGWRSRYLGSFGDDVFGELSRESLLAEGVSLEGSRTVAGATNQFAIVLVDAPSGERTVLWDRHPSLTLDPEAVSRDDVTSGRILVVDCHDTPASSQAAKYGREQGVFTVVDVEKVRPRINELLQNIDAIIAAQEFPAELTGYEEPGRAIEAIAREFSTPLVCVTLGDEGSLALCGGRELRTPAFSVDCVDSTGAGDAFRGGFAAGVLRYAGGDLEDVLRYANAVAALNCRRLGARGGMPTAEEVDELLCTSPAPARDRTTGRRLV